LEIFYPRKFIINYYFLNYINIFEFLLGFKPFFKKLGIFLYVVTKKKKLIFTKKKKFSFLKFKFLLFFNLKLNIFFIFIKHIFILIELYKKIFDYFNLDRVYYDIFLFKFNNGIQIFKFLNIYLLLKLFFFYKDSAIPTIIFHDNKFLVNIYFYKIKINNLNLLFYI